MQEQHDGLEQAKALGTTQHDELEPRLGTATHPEYPLRGAKDAGVLDAKGAPHQNSAHYDELEQAKALGATQHDELEQGVHWPTGYHSCARAT